MSARIQTKKKKSARPLRSNGLQHLPGTYYHRSCLDTTHTRHDALAPEATINKALFVRWTRKAHEKQKQQPAALLRFTGASGEPQRRVHTDVQPVPSGHLRHNTRNLSLSPMSTILTSTNFLICRCVWLDFHTRTVYAAHTC